MSRWTERSYRVRRVDAFGARFFYHDDELDDYVRRVEFAKAMLTGIPGADGLGTEDQYALENAELAVDTALKCDEMRDDLITTVSNYGLFLHATASAYSREYLIRFCFVVDCLRRAPARTRQ